MSRAAFALSASLLALASIASAGLVHAQPTPVLPTAPSQAPADPQAMAAALQKSLRANAPGVPQSLLAARAGRYATQIVLQLGSAGPTQQSTGVATLTSIAGGRFLLEENSAMLMGQPTTGTRLYGYNNATQQYEASWVHNGSTAILQLIGTSADGGATIEYTGSYVDPIEGKQALRVSMRYIDDDRFAVTVAGADSTAPHYARMETTYTREK